MAISNAKLKKEVLDRFKHTQMIFLSTCSGKKPKVRPVMLIYFKKKCWVATSAKDAKIKQIKKNKNIEFCLLLKTKKYAGYIRGSGKAIIIKDAKTRKTLAENIPFFKQYFKDASDPGFALLRLNIKEIEYIKPGKMEVMKLKF